jgi:chromosome segregation ATPase
MKQQMESSSQIDEAFKAIKTETGVTDVQEMVKRFCTRETTYTQLLVNVKDSENKVTRLMQNNDHLKSRLHDLKVNSGNAEGEDDEADKKDPFADEDILEMKATIDKQKKDMEHIDEKYKKIDIVYDQVRGYTNKVMFKYKTLNLLPADLEEKSLAYCFEKLAL